MLKRILSPFLCCVSPPSNPKPEPNPIPEPNRNPEPNRKPELKPADVAGLEPEEEIDPIAMLAAVMAAPRRRVFQPSFEPFPHLRRFKPTLEPISEDPEGEAEALRAELADLQAEKAAELDEQLILASEVKVEKKGSRNNWMKRMFKKAKEVVRRERKELSVKLGVKKREELI